MNLRTEWGNDTSISNRFYTVEETINEVKENFDIRRLYSAEGKNVTINNVTEKCLVQTSSNPLRDLDDQRKIHCPLSMNINRGDYVEYENAVWLITTNVANIDDAYQSARMSMCNWQLMWQNYTGEIISRWAYISSASKYNDGETENNVITLGSDQLSVQIPVDDESLNIKRKTKFFIDNNDSDPTVYELTGINNVTNTYKAHGTTSWIVKECAYSPTADDLKYGVCNYITPTLPPVPGENPDKTTVHLTISSAKDYLRLGGQYTTFKGAAADVDNNSTDDVGLWNIECDFVDHLIFSISGNQIKIKISDDFPNFIGQTFKLIFSVGNTSTFKEIKIKE